MIRVFLVRQLDYYKIIRGIILSGLFCLWGNHSGSKQAAFLFMCDDCWSIENQQKSMTSPKKVSIDTAMVSITAYQRWTGTPSKEEQSTALKASPDWAVKLADESQWLTASSSISYCLSEYIMFLYPPKQHWEICTMMTSTTIAAKRLIEQLKKMWSGKSGYWSNKSLTGPIRIRPGYVGEVCQQSFNQSHHNHPSTIVPVQQAHMSLRRNREKL